MTSRKYYRNFEQLAFNSFDIIAAEPNNYINLLPRELCAETKKYINREFEYNNTLDANDLKEIADIAYQYECKIKLYRPNRESRWNILEIIKIRYLNDNVLKITTHRGKYYLIRIDSAFENDGFNIKHVRINADYIYKMFGESIFIFDASNPVGYEIDKITLLTTGECSRQKKEHDSCMKFLWLILAFLFATIIYAKLF